jgi:hypothetical protein
MVLAAWNQQYEPVADNLALSALVAALPVIILLGLLGLLKVKAHYAALAGLATAFLVALLVYGMPAPTATAALANGALIAYRFHARDLHLVMGPAAQGTSVRFRVLIDGQSPGAAHGIDVDDQGDGTVTQQRLYQLIRQRGPSPSTRSRLRSSTLAFRSMHSLSARSKRNCPA